MVQDSRWQRESCCSHSYSIRKTRGQPTQCQKEETAESTVGGGKSNPEGKREGQRKCFSPRLFLQVWAGRRKCVSSAALCNQRYRTQRQGETEWRERVWNRVREGEWEVPDSEREGEGRVIYVLRCSIAPAWFQLQSNAGKCPSQETEAVETNAEGWDRTHILHVCKMQLQCYYNSFQNRKRKPGRKWGWHIQIGMSTSARSS